jgi:hypothetical protein
MNHKSRGWAPAIALLATLPILWLHGAAQAPKPVLTNKIYTYFIGPPDTLKEMILAADAVVYGRILAAAANDSVSPIGGALVRTAYRVKVNELLHTLGGHPIDTDHIVVLREGGDRDRGTHIERVVQENFPSFSVGGEYVLFLRWNPSQQAWAPAFGPGSVFRLSKGRVDSFGSSGIAAAQTGKTAAAFLETIRSFGG